MDLSLYQQLNWHEVGNAAATIHSPNIIALES